jgi:hypothetical protein
MNLNSWATESGVDTTTAWASSVWTTWEGEAARRVS